MSGKLVVLVGPAAVGKSTIARALQSQLSRDGALWLVQELDLFGRGMPRHWIGMSEWKGRNAALGFDYVRDGEAVGLALGPDGRRVLAAFHRAIAAVVASGVNVICEAIVYDEEDWRDWNEVLSGIATCWVRLFAPLDVLDAREAERPNQAMRGLARGMSERPPVGTYDMEFNTSALDARAIAARIAAVGQDRP